MNDINKFQKILNDYLKQCKNVQNKNENVVISIIKKLKDCGKLMKESIDNAVNTLAEKVYILYWFEFVFFFTKFVGPLGKPCFFVVLCL